MANLIRANFSKKQIRIVPGEPPTFEANNALEERCFGVTVVNTSSQFASFQVELTAPGMDADTVAHWYRVTPEICAKKPPGDRTDFEIVVTHSPIATYGTTISLIVNIYSVEYADLSASETIELVIDRPKNPIRLYLPLKELKVYPGDRLEIPVIAYNLSDSRQEIYLDLEPQVEETVMDWREWLLPESRQFLQIEAGDSSEVRFCCTPPRTAQSIRGIYPFTIEIRNTQGNTLAQPRTLQGNIEVLPYGVMEWACENPIQSIPGTGIHQGFNHYEITYPLHLKNASNLEQRIVLEIFRIHQKHEISQSLVDRREIHQKPEQHSLEQWITEEKRPWLGMRRQRQFKVIPQLCHGQTGEAIAPIHPTPDSQLLELNIRPIIPFWLQISGGLLLLLSSLLMLWLRMGAHHDAPVNSVRLIGNETTVVSGSNDQTVRRWSVSPFDWFLARDRLWSQGTIANSKDTGGGVRVIRERPLQDGQVAVGLQNGDIQLWNVAPPQRLDQEPLFAQRDRVFDLAFTRDSTVLFSGHGSGVVRRWNLNGVDGVSLQESRPPAPQQVSTRAAVTALTVLDAPRAGNIPLVAIAGQYYQLSFWDWQSDSPVLYQLNAQGRVDGAIATGANQYQYINSLSTDEKNTRLVTADSEGFITLWDMEKIRQCIQQQNISSEPADPQSVRLKRDDFGNILASLPCSKETLQIARWQATQNHLPVRSVALSENGCYLASAGEDGRLLLWFLHQKNGSSHTPPSEQIQQFSAPLRTVDLKQPTQDTVVIASDAPGNEVRLYHRAVDVEGCR